MAGYSPPTFGGKSGRLLMVAPFPYHREKRKITREQCLTLNEWTKAIVNGTASND